MFGVELETLLTWASVYGGVIVVAASLAMIVWAFRDIRSRSRDFSAQIIVTILVALLSLPGLIIYILLRPKETLADAYERSLEEEALLQEIENKPTCPGCGQRIQEDWQACPYCHTRLQKPCIHCRELLQLSWEICPYCTSAQTSGTVDANPQRGHVSRGVRQPSNLPPSIPQNYTSPRPTTMDDALELLDED